MKKRSLSLLLALSMILTLLPAQVFAAGTTAEPVDTTNPFEDVRQDDQFYNEVQYVRMNGIFHGTGETTFWPEGTMTRGMFITVLGRMAGVDPDNYSGVSSFADVPGDAYYAPFVAWAAKYGVTAGTGDGRFSPNAYIDRQQMATFFARYFEAFNVTYETGDDITSTPMDIDSVSPWARDAVLKLWQTGLLNGDGTSFRPAGHATRAQVATICCRTDEAVDTWYSEPGVPSTRVKIDPSTGLPFKKDDKPVDPSRPGTGSGGGSYTVTFKDGSRTIASYSVKKGEPLGKVPTVKESSKAGYILEGYYTDPRFATPFYAGDPVTGSMTVYARYESMGGAETVTPNSFARMDQASDVSFTIKPADDGGTLDDDTVTLLVKDGSAPVEIKVEENRNGTYTVSAPGGFNPGCSYELDLAEGWTFVYPEYPDADTIRTAAFSIKMEEVENLQMNEGIRYIKDTEEIDYTYTDKDNKTYSNIAELPSNADISKGGSFDYNQADSLSEGDILCIYVGGKPDSNEPEPTREAIYAKVSGVSGNTVSFAPLAQEDQLKLYEIPDNFPIKVGALPPENTGTVNIGGLDTATYAMMVGADEAAAIAAAKAKLNVGDFVTLYTDAKNIASEGDVYFGKVTKVVGDEITYTRSSAQEIRDSADLYKSVENTDMITPEEQEEIQRIVQAQVERSDFAMEAAAVLADMAVRTEGFQSKMRMMSLAATGEDGEPLSDEELASYAGIMTLADDGTPEVKVQVITDKSKLHFGSKGVQLAVNVSAEFEVDGKDDGKIKFELSATFVQEVAVDPKVKGELVYKEILGFIPVPTGVQVNAIVDVKSYTAMSLRADIYTVAAEDKSTWEKFKGFLKDPSDLGSIPGMPDAVANGIKTVGDALNEIEEIKAKIDKGLEDTKKLESDLNALWGAVEKAAKNGLTRDSYESACKELGKTNVAGELMDMLHLADGDIEAEYLSGLSDLMDAYAELLERETDWVQLVDVEMFNASTPAYYGVMVGVQGKFVVRADMNIALGSNLEYEVGKRYNFWFRVGLFTPTSGSSTMDLIDEHFAFQFYVMGKLGLKAGVRIKAYAAIGSADAISVGLTTELGPYVKLWGFFIYDHQKYRPKNSRNWTSKEQMTGALYMEFGLYLMVGLEAKALFLDYGKNFVDEEFPLLSAGERRYCYAAAYEPEGEDDEIVVYDDHSAEQREGCAVSMELPEYTYALKYMDLTTGRQGTSPLSPRSYTFKVSNPNFRVDIVKDRPVVSVISIPEGVQVMQCDLTITYKYGKLVFSSLDISTTVHLVWTSLTPQQYQKFYTAYVAVPDGDGGMEAIWSKRVRKGQPFDLPTVEEIEKLLNWSEAKYTAGTGYNGQPTEGLTIAQDTQYNYDLSYKSYSLTVDGIEGGGNASQTFTAKYGEPFSLSDLSYTGKDGEDNKYTRFVGLMYTDAGDQTQTLDLDRPADGKITAATAQYVDETITAIFEFTGIEQEAIEVKLRRGDTPNTKAVVAAVPNNKAITGFYPDVGAQDGSMAYQVVCEDPRGAWVPIIFNANGGDAVDPDRKYVGSVLGDLPVPKYTGHGFDGWFTDDGTFQDQVDANTRVPKGGMTLYAKWTKGRVTVTFDTNGGLNLTENTKFVIYDQPYDTLPVPVLGGKGFIGWFTEQKGGTQVTANTTVTETGDHTLYAHWGDLLDLTANSSGDGKLFAVGKRTVTYSRNKTWTLEDLKHLYVQRAGIVDSKGNDVPTKGFCFALKPKSAGGRSDGTAKDAGTYILEITREADNTYGAYTETHDILVIEKADWVEAIWDPTTFTAVIYGKDNTLTNTVTVKTPTGTSDLPQSIVDGMKWKMHRHKKGTFKEKTATYGFGSTFGDNGSGATCEVYLVFPSGATSNNYILPSQVLMYSGNIRDLYTTTKMKKKHDEPVPTPKDTMPATATFTVEHYIMDVDGGYPADASYTQTVTDTAGTTLTLEKLKRTEYEEDGITYDSAKTGTTVTISQGMTIKLYYTRARHTVIWDVGEEGTLPDGVSKTQEVCHGAAVTPPTDPPTKPGYTFAGWYTDEDCTSKVTDEMKVTKDMTFYAKWTESTGESTGEPEPGGDEDESASG